MASHIPQMDWSSSDLADAFQLLRQKLDLYIADKNITQLPKHESSVVVSVTMGYVGWTLAALMIQRSQA